jgi:hypothetical protein
MVSLTARLASKGVTRSKDATALPLEFREVFSTVSSILQRLPYRPGRTPRTNAIGSREQAHPASAMNVRQELSREQVASGSQNAQTAKGVPLVKSEITARVLAQGSACLFLRECTSLNLV